MNQSVLPPLSGKLELILGVKGQEYQAIVFKVPKKLHNLQILAIPAGLKPVNSFLNFYYQSRESLNKLPCGVLLMGLCGGLSPHYRVGESILYRGCGYQTPEGEWRYLSCDYSLTQALAERLGSSCRLGQGISCDRVITHKDDKLKLGKQYQMDVIDMESFAVLEFFQPYNIPIAILRVVSDDCQQNLPDLSNIFDKNGDIKPFILAQKMLQKPLASYHLIRSSLSALKALENITEKLMRDQI